MPATLAIVDEFCMRAFDLNPDKEYFVKTGTYSSKFDFRNAHVYGEKEVHELGEYLLFIQNQAVLMAGPLSKPSIYGVSTTNEWCVREYIKDKENNPCIYHGMPLHTEYRFFIECHNASDENTILGVSPYWREDVMTKNLGEGPLADSADKKHDYIIYCAHKDTLMKRYNDSISMLTKEVEKLIKNLNLEGQWSLDIMQNGDDFYLIDMALASQSALSDCVPKGIIKKADENWIPDLSE